MCSIRAELKPAERRELLRELWWAHDARWFLKVAQELGFDTANRLNQAVIRSMGKTEAKELMTRTGAQLANIGDIKEFIEMGGEIYWPEEHKYENGGRGGEPHRRARPAMLRLERTSTRQAKRPWPVTAALRPPVFAAGWTRSACRERS